jgi:hypothetical protein
MKAQELRIGNYIKYPTIVRPLRVSIIDTTETNVKTKAEPIKLNEEWLIKLGGVKATDPFGGYLFYYPNGNGMRIKNNEWSSQHITVKVEFVHQLQNLYYSLTGEELC